MPTLVHARLRVGGALYSDARWSVGINFAQADGTDPFANGTLDVQGALEQWADAVRALNTRAIFPEAMLEGLSSGGTVDTIRAARIGTDGKESAVALVSLGTTPQKGVGTPLHSAQTALTVSLLTARPGGSYRGRFYLPALGYPVNAAGRINPTLAQPIADASAQWLRDVAQSLPDGAAGVLKNVPAVVSSRQGTTVPVNRVRVGDRLDTQRRRAESQEEAYSSAQLPN